jgi:hypothetical protein
VTPRLRSTSANGFSTQSSQRRGAQTEDLLLDEEPSQQGYGFSPVPELSSLPLHMLRQVISAWCTHQVSPHQPPDYECRTDILASADAVLQQLCSEALGVVGPFALQQGLLQLDTTQRQALIQHMAECLVDSPARRRLAF